MPKVTQRKQRLVRSRTYGGFGAPIVSTVTTTTLPTQRKVSEEDMHSSSSSSSSSFESLHQVLKNSTTAAKFNEDGSYRNLPCNISNSNNSSDMAETTTTSRENSFRLMKRPAPSVCLVDLASEESSQQQSTNFTIICPSSPAPSSTTALPHTTPPRRRAASASEASSPWGHFIEMLMEDQAEYSSGCLGKNTCFLPSCPPSPFRLDRFSHCNNNNDPYPRLKPKRHCRHSVSAPLSGFALAFSDMEETANQLSSLTF